ncbi:hypothetical protein [Haloarchaeobius sp. TZWSO28]|uniref:hypothetical protein n=1 Tax=Haloarchaeobius sp. TZWSO28 TaxID=3446119 RepID=UPI003EBC0982
MRRQDTNVKAQLRGRRGFLKLLSGLGISTAAISNISQETLAKLDVDLDKEVPYIDRYRHTNRSEIANGKAPKREPVYETIDRSKWSEIEGAHVAAQKINGQINSLRSNTAGPTLITTDVTTTSDGKAIRVMYQEKQEYKQPDVTSDSGNTPEKELEIRSPEISLETLEQNLPSQVSASAPVEKVDFRPETRTYPVFVESTTVHNTDQCKRYHFNSGHGHDIPAGCKMHGDGNGTLGTPANHDGLGDYVMVTAGHAFDSSSSMHQPKKGWWEHKDGVRHTYEYDNGNGDYALIKAPHDHDGWKLYHYRLADGSGGFKDDVYISGTITWDSIKYHEGDSSWTVERQGARTGMESGSITGTHTNNGKFVKTDIAQGRGDSGGAVFKRYQNSDVESLYIVSINTKGYGSTGSNCKFDISGGSAMAYIEEKEGLTV